MNCPNCQAENREGARFCRVCAHALASELPASEESQDGTELREIAPPLSEPDHATAAMQDRVQVATGSDEEPAPVALIPCTVGTSVQDRYTILEVLQADTDHILYRVRDALRCPDPACRAENAADDQFCQNCGRELNERGTCLLEARNAPEDIAAVLPPAFVFEDRVYMVQEETPAVAIEAGPFPSGVRLTVGIKSDVGRVRGDAGEPDEDSVFAMVCSTVCESVALPTAGLFMVADGVGGSDAGEVASQKVVQAVAGELLSQVVLPVLASQTPSDEAIREYIHDAIVHANEQVLRLANEKKNDMGTTLTLALVLNDKAYLANVGDSRTYLFDGKLQQVTRDHSMVASLIATGLAQPEEIYTHPQRNLILRSLGAKPELDVDIFPMEGGAVKLKPGARLLLCCDGLWEMARDDDIEECLLLESDPQKACEKLIARANEAGGEDNISVIVVNIS